MPLNEVNVEATVINVWRIINCSEIPLIGFSGTLFVTVTTLVKEKV